MTAWSPLAGGVLTGKYAEGKAAADARLNSEMMKGFNRDDERARRVVAEVQAVAREVGRSPAQVALAWLRHRPVPVIPIVGARRLEQFRDNLACLDLTLSGEQVDRLDAASHVELGFPHDFYDRDMVKALVSGGLGDRFDMLTSKRSVKDSHEDPRHPDGTARVRTSQRVGRGRGSCGRSTSCSTAPGPNRSRSTPGRSRRPRASSWWTRGKPHGRGNRVTSPAGTRSTAWRSGSVVTPEQEVGPQLLKLGIRPDDVRTVILTHLHTDHAGGLHHFPSSEILVTDEESRLAKGFVGQLRGYLPNRWPQWFAPRSIGFDKEPSAPLIAAIVDLGRHRGHRADAGAHAGTRLGDRRGWRYQLLPGGRHDIHPEGPGRRTCRWDQPQRGGLVADDADHPPVRPRNPPSICPPTTRSRPERLTSASTLAVNEHVAV